MSDIPRRRWLTFLLLSMTGGVIYQVAYIRFVFLEYTYTALRLTGQEYGVVISVFGAVATVMYFFGGWFSDRYSPKLLITVALVGTGAADFVLASVPSFTGILLAHVVMAVMGMALYWSALVKAIGMLGSASEQGRLFGFLEGARGITSTIVGLVGAGIVAAAVVPSGGVLTLIRIYGALCFVFAALVWLFVREDRARIDALGRSTVTLGQLLVAARNPYTWLIGGTIALAFCFYTTLGYFSPLLQNEFGVGAAALSIIGVVRSYVFQFVAGPVGGVIVDTVTHSTSRFLRLMFAVSLVFSAAFLLLPRSPELVGLAVVLLLLLCIPVFMSRGVYWATVGELGIPENQRGGVIGLASGLAYLPDAFLPALCAWWIGDPNAATPVPERGGGYSALFVFLLVAAALGILLTSITTRLHERRRREALVPAPL